MELGEVVNANYAVPVVGVILCALLVFAFGFKSSVQPSFDFEDDRKSNKKRKPKKTQQGNGHISSSIDAEEKKSNKQVPQIKAQIKTSPKVQQLKQKKAEIVQKEDKESKQLQNNVESVENDGEGEWTTQISRKLKKQKQKQEETKEQASPVEEKIITTDIPSDKNTVKKNESNAEVHEKIENKEEKLTAKSSDKKSEVIATDKLQKVSGENEKENKQVIDTAAVKKNDEEVSPKEKRSPRKKTKKKDVGNDLDNKTATLEEYTIKTKPDLESDGLSAELDQSKEESLKSAISSKKSIKSESEPHIIESFEDKNESPGNTQSKKKKKSSKLQQKSSNSGEDSEVRSSPSHIPKNIQNEPHNLLQELNQPQEKENKRPISEAAKETPAAKDTNHVVSAEELSDQWLEAKTPRKKKKARRDT